MAILESDHPAQRTSGIPADVLDSIFDETVEGLDTDDLDGFAPLARIASARTAQAKARSAKPRPLLDQRMVPVTITTDGTTATQILMLLGIIRYCMESSREVLDPKTGEAKEYRIDLRVKNRGRSGLLVSVGDESVQAIPIPDGEFTVGS